MSETNRRRSDIETNRRIDRLQEDLIACSTGLYGKIDVMSESFSKFCGQFEELGKKLDDNSRETKNLSKQMEKANDAGFQEILQSHQDSRGFSAVSVKFGKILLGIAAVGGAIAAIVGFGASFILSLMQGK